MTKTSNLPEREAWVLKKIMSFYADKCNLDKFLDIINNNSKKKLSLRLIDWFVTNYSKKHNVAYPIERPGGHLELFAPYQRYRDQLSSYPKKMFDPFCRGNYLVIDYDTLEILNGNVSDDTTQATFQTAICQLHFFKWAIENLVIEYISDNIEEIYQDMSTNCSKVNRDLIRKTKQQLSKSIYEKMVVQHDIPIKITWGWGTS